MASRMDKIYTILKNNKGKMEFNLIFEALLEKDKDTENTPEDKASIFTDITIDGRFLFSREIIEKKETHFLDIRDNYTYEEIKESLSTFGDAGELEGDDVDLISPSRPTIASTKTEDDDDSEDKSEEIDDSPVKDIDSSTNN